MILAISNTREVLQYRISYQPLPTRTPPKLILNWILEQSRLPITSLELVRSLWCCERSTTVLQNVKTIRLKENNAMDARDCARIGSQMSTGGISHVATAPCKLWFRNAIYAIYKTIVSQKYVSMILWIFLWEYQTIVKLIDRQRKVQIDHALAWSIFLRFISQEIGLPMCTLG